MIRSLRTAALGMSAQQLNVDTISNNLANVNTTGFKKSMVEFQDLLYETVNTGSTDGSKEFARPNEIQIGLGNKPVSTYRSFSQGSVEQTSNALDLAINGNGFFQVMQADGEIAFTRDGTFQINSSGYVVNSSGLKLYPEITVPDDVSAIEITEDGTISVTSNNETESEEIGQIELATFLNPTGLEAIGGNLYTQTEASGDPTYGIPGEDNFGTVEQGYLEKSNVDVVQEMINLIVAQRAYEINSKAIKTADDLLSMTNNLKR